MSILSFYILPNNICIFSKTTCGYCKKATQLLYDVYGIEYQLVELDKINYGPNIATELKNITGQTTVPNIFIYGKHIGGYSELFALHKNGTLNKMIQDNQHATMKYVCEYCGTKSNTNQLTCSCIHRAFGDWGSPM
jgi:glutaredoxin 3